MLKSKDPLVMGTSTEPGQHTTPAAAALISPHKHRLVHETGLHEHTCISLEVRKPTALTRKVKGIQSLEAEEGMRRQSRG